MSAFEPDLLNGIFCLGFPRNLESRLNEQAYRESVAAKPLGSARTPYSESFLNWFTKFYPPTMGTPPPPPTSPNPRKSVLDTFREEIAKGTYKAPTPTEESNAALRQELGKIVWGADYGMNSSKTITGISTTALRGRNIDFCIMDDLRETTENKKPAPHTSIATLKNTRVLVAVSEEHKLLLICDSGPKGVSEPVSRVATGVDGKLVIQNENFRAIEFPSLARCYEAMQQVHALLLKDSSIISVGTRHVTPDALHMVNPDLKRQLANSLMGGGESKVTLQVISQYMQKEPTPPPIAKRIVLVSCKAENIPWSPSQGIPASIAYTVDLEFVAGETFVADKFKSGLGPLRSNFEAGTTSSPLKYMGCDVAANKITLTLYGPIQGVDLRKTVAGAVVMHLRNYLSHPHRKQDKFYYAGADSIL